MTTRLARMLVDTHERPDAIAAFLAARRAFKAGDRIEMRELAATLGVSRATLFRWVGSRDQLLTEVVWSLTHATLQRAIAAAEGLRGGERIVEVIGRFAELSHGSEPLMAFVRREPERALRLLTTRASPFQARLVAAFESVLTEEIDAARLDPPLPVHDLAYVILRIGESFVYADVIAGEVPEPARVRQTIGALLRVGGTDELGGT